MLAESTGYPAQRSLWLFSCLPELAFTRTLRQERSDQVQQKGLRLEQLNREGIEMVLGNRGSTAGNWGFQGPLQMLHGREVTILLSKPFPCSTNS